jgi:hypothetical protein
MLHFPSPRCCMTPKWIFRRNWLNRINDLVRPGPKFPPIRIFRERRVTSQKADRDRFRLFDL